MNRAERRHRMKKRGDLCRLKTHKMRTNMGMKVEAQKSTEQKKVDKAVRDELKKLKTPKVVQPDKLIEVPEPKIPNRYYCTACRRYHVLTSKIGSEHTNFYLAE